MQTSPDHNATPTGPAAAETAPSGENSANKMFLVFGAMIVILLLMTVVSFRAVSELNDASGWNTHTYEVLTEVKGMSQGLYNMQMGARSYLQTGDTALLLAWNSGKKDVSLHFANAQAMTKDNPKQQERLALFKDQFGKWMNMYIPLIKMRHDPAQADAALAQAKTQADDRNALVSSLKSSIADLVTEEEALKAQRAQSMASWANVTRTTLLVDGLLTIVLVSVLSMFLVRTNKLLGATNAGLSKEVADRKKAEREIRDLHDYNEQILSSTTEGIIGLNPRGRITFANPAAAKMIAWDPQQVIGKAVDSVLQRDMADATLSPTRDNLLNASLRDGRVHSVPDGVFTRKDGSRFNVEYTITPLKEEGSEFREDAETTVTGAVITFRDITVRKRTEMSLLRLASIVESSKDAILGHNLDGRIVSWNSAATKLYGYAPREVEGCTMSILFPPDRSEEVLYLIEKIKAGERVEPYQTVVMAKGGETVDVAITMFPVKDAAGNVMGACSNARRIVRRRTEEQLPVYMTELRLVNDGESNAEAQPAGVVQSAT